MTAFIHPTAIVGEQVLLADKVHIGPYCHLEGEVSIGEGSVLQSHVVVRGRTTIGKHNRIFPFSSLGVEPQDLKFHGEDSRLEIGDHNTIRENVTMSLGTEGGGMLTRIGDHNLLMAYVHIAHDCLLGHRIVMANAATLAGHVEIDDGAIIGGLSAVHQFLRIGSYAMIGGMSGIVKDVPPYCLTAGGYRPGLVGLNSVGLKRQKTSMTSLRIMKSIYRLLLQSSTTSLKERLQAAEALAEGDEKALHLIDFVRTAKRGLTLHGRGDDD